MPWNPSSEKYRALAPNTLTEDPAHLDGILKADLSDMEHPGS